MDCLSGGSTTSSSLTKQFFGCILSTCVLTLVVFLGIFALANPDKPAVYGKLDDEPALYASMEEAIEAGATDLSNVHALFVHWSLWGFVLALCPLPLAAMALASYCIN